MVNSSCELVPQVLQLLYYFLRFECFCSLRGLMNFFHLVMLQIEFWGNHYFQIEGKSTYKLPSYTDA